jgi:glycolate oxidase FAD binding subunit
MSDPVTVAPFPPGDLVAALERNQVHLGDAAHVDVDGLKPGIVMEPETLSQLRTCLTETQNRRCRVICIGGGRHVHRGNVPEPFDVAVSTARLNRIIDHQPADMTVTVEAGVRLADLQAALAKHGQFLPLDPPGAEGATIGGLLAADVSGPLRHRYGTARDWLIGARVVHADGTTSKSGGRVVKNVSGYDVHKLYVGSLGTLAVIAEATFKLVPLPNVDRTVAVGCPSAAAAQSIITAAHERGLAVIAAELLSPAAATAVCGLPEWTALLRVAGGSAAVARTLDEIGDYAALAKGEQTEPEDAWERWRTAFAPAPLSLRLSAAPSQAGTLAETLDRRLAGDAARLSATSTAGLVRVNLSPADDARAMAIIESAREIAAQRGGFAIVEAALPAVKRLIDVFGPPRADIEIMRRLKRQFDPELLLAPGRFAGKI